MSSILIKNGTVLTMAPEMEVIENGAVYLKDDKIADFGKSSEVEARNEKAEKVIDAEGKFIMPAMTNAHTHLYSTFARGMASKEAPAANFQEILERLWWKLDKQLTLEDCYYSALMPMIDSIRRGVTTILDHHAGPFSIEGSLDQNERALKETGLRGSLCYELSDRDGMEIRDQGIAENIRFAKKCLQEKDPMVKAMFGLHAAFTLSDESLEKAKAAEAEVGCGFHVHVAEAQSDVDYNLKHYGQRAAERLHKHGMTGDKSLFIHCVYVDEAEMDLIKSTDTAAVHNPHSNMGNAVGVAPVLKMLEKGLLVGLGTDAYTNDMFDSFRQANILHKIANRDPRVSWGEPVQMAFYNNAKIMSRYFDSPLGIIAKGAAADVILMEYAPPTPLVAANVFGHVHFGMGSFGVHTTIAAGKVLMENRKLVNIDEERISAKSRELAQKLWDRI